MKISICGIACGRCPKYVKKQCSGCAPNPVCKMPECAKEKGVKLCFECKEFPCNFNLNVFQKEWLDFLKSDIHVG